MIEKIKLSLAIQKFSKIKFDTKIDREKEKLFQAISEGVTSINGLKRLGFSQNTVYRHRMNGLRKFRGSTKKSFKLPKNDKNKFLRRE